VLPLAGPRADVTAAQVTTWQTGFPLQVDFRDGAPTARIPAMRPVPDAMVYVAPLATAEAPPAPGVPLVVLGHAGAASWKADAFIPVGTPGVHHAGHYFRTDAVVALRMRKLADGGLPSVADVLQHLTLAIGDRP
jgi:formylmethanofuran dehydrogenase subunit B